MKEVVDRLGGKFVSFHRVDTDAQDRIVRAVLTPDERANFLRQLAQSSSAEHRYQLEYNHRLYQSYKPGIDDGLDSLVGLQINRSVIVEIGGGPAYLAAHAGRGICADIVPHPRLSDVGVRYLHTDICHTSAPSQIIEHLGADDRPVVVVLSYCLDRVPDQKLALRHFAEIVHARQAVGLITVCLPAKPTSSGIDDLSYATGEWITQGHDAQVDYEQIVSECQRQGLKFQAGGVTVHHGVSLDGYETLPCYVMVFNP